MANGQKSQFLCVNLFGGLGTAFCSPEQHPVPTNLHNMNGSLSILRATT